ncbi:methylaspartate mutase [Micromonospora tulbaghiae]|uniref:Methylaspartate mutase n=1 Tax=Micromonospora tulbaghiae TaxID=479978 RepID=A0A386WWU4_9ACTN|nr:methylaspartate mutase [Micromonospora tulbaghiae]AYF31958.1 methylaspartate mutase [Micromonospora tulbaghiae]
MPADFGAFVQRAADRGDLVVQPRMGFSDPALMRAGLDATRRAGPGTVGTITLDSYTRVGDLAAVSQALADRVPLNGYPITGRDPSVTRAMLAGIRSRDFPVQVRHGSATPHHIFDALVGLGLNVSEGGPVSYCLPYGRTSLADSVGNWAECVRRFATLREWDIEPHLETFGGCMLGQLCPPSLLVALSVLEALFFSQHGVRSVSVSYAQQTNLAQDIEAVGALRRLCSELLPVRDWHTVIYTYMGLYPATDEGAIRLLGESARLAVYSGSERLIVKTVAESRRIPTVAENVAALRYAGSFASSDVLPTVPGQDSTTYDEARALIEAVLDLHPGVGRALLIAFDKGYLDVPYCLHPDNRGRTRSYVAADGWLRWSDTGALPVRHAVRDGGGHRITSAGLLTDLSYVRRTYDRPTADALEAAAVVVEGDSADDWRFALSSW